VQAEVLIILIALFMGPTNDQGSAYIFQNPTFSKKESCEEFVIEKQNMLHTYVSAQYKTLPTIFPSLYYCIPVDELEEFLESKPKKDIAV
jgi:hypothetical protein